MITITLLATFRLVAGVKSFTLEVQPGMTILDAIQSIIECYPVLRSHWVDESGELHAHVHVFCNGEDVSTLPDGLTTALRSGDALDFFPPVAGG